MHTVRTVLGLFALCMAAIAPAKEATACSCVGPEHWGFVLEDKGVIPRNVPGVLWAGGVADKTAFKVERLGKGKATPVPFTLTPQNGAGLYVLVALQTAPKPGQRFAFTTTQFNPYRFSGSGSGPGPTEQRVEVVASSVALALTDKDVSIAVQTPTLGMLQVSSSGGMCAGSMHAAHMGVTLKLPTKQVPFRHLLLFSTQVDGAAWSPRHSLCHLVLPGRSWMPKAGTDRLYTHCPKPLSSEAAQKQPPVSVMAMSKGLSQGPHRVAIEVTSPASLGVTVRASAAADVALTCAIKAP